MTRWIFGLALLLALGAPAGSGAAPAGQPTGLTMTVRAGYDGHYKLGEWFPVQVMLNNTGQSLDRAEVQVNATGNNDWRIATYARQVDLPAPARKRITLYTYATTYQHTLGVRLVRNETVLLEQKVPIEPLTNEFLLGVVSDTPDLLNYLAGSTLTSAAQTTVAHLAPDDIPASTAALYDLNGLVIANTDTSKLSAEARQALAGWVTAGRILVVAGGAAGPATSAGVADLLPVALGSSRPFANGETLAAFVGSASAAPIGGVASETQLLPDRGGIALIDGPSGPLLAQRGLGRGVVLALALDPSSPALKTWDRNTDFWKHIFGGHTVQVSLAAARRMQYSYYGSNPYGIQSLYSYNISQLSPYDLPLLELPGVGLVGGFLLLYVLLVGPINYLVLRRWRRYELAWLTIPSIILLFVVASYMVAYQSKGSNFRLIDGTIVHAYPSSPAATVESFIGLFSPNRDTYSLEVSADAQISEVNSNGLGTSDNSATIYQGKPSSIHDINIDTWSLRTFLAEATVPYQSPYQAHLELRQGVITGQLTNRGSTALRDVMLISGNDVQALGMLAAGESKEVKLASRSPGGQDLEVLIPKLVPGIQVQTGPPPKDPAEISRRRRGALLVGALAGTSGPPGELGVEVVGWSEGLPFDVRVSQPAAIRDDLVVIAGRLAVEPPAGKISLTPGLIPRTLVSGQAETTGWSAANGSFLHINGLAIFEYHLPSTITVDSLTLSYARLDAGDANIEVFNWKTNTWDAIKIGPVNPYSGAIPDPAAHVRNGQVRLRVQPANSGDQFMNIDRLDLSAEGHR